MSNGLRLCPQCGSPGVNFSSLAGGAADCRGCHWKGSVEDLLNVPGTSMDENMLSSVMNDLRKLLSGELGLPYLKFLLKWGFMAGSMSDPAGTVDRKAFARYLAAIGRSILVALFEERSRMEAVNAAERSKALS